MNIFLTLSGLGLSDLTGSVSTALLATLQEITCGPLSLQSSQEAPAPCVVTAQGSVSLTLLATMPRSRQDEIVSAGIVLQHLLEHSNGNSTNTTIIAVCGLAVGEIKSASNLGQTMGIAFGVVGAAAASVLCCRRKRGKKAQLAIATGIKSTFAPNNLSKHGRAAAPQAAQLFDWLDQDGKGVVSAVELSDTLGISPLEASTLIEEIHKTVGDGSSTAKLEMSKDDFLRLLEPLSPTEIDVMALPKEKLERYQLIFESIDVHASGMITPDQVSITIGDDFEDLNNAFVDRGYLTFPELAAVLQKFETDRVVGTILDLLAATGQNTLLIEAINTQRQVRKARGLPRLKLSEFELNSSLSLEDQSSSLETPQATVDNKVAQGIIEDVWRSACGDAQSGDVHSVRLAIMESHAIGTLKLTDCEILDIACKIDDACTDGVVSFVAYRAVMQQYGDYGAKKWLGPRQTSAHMSSDDEFSLVGLPFPGQRAASMRRLASLGRTQSSASNQSEPFDCTSIPAHQNLQRTSRNAKKPKKSLTADSECHLASPTSIAKAVLVGQDDELARELHDASLASEQMQTTKRPRRQSLADDLHDASMVAGVTMKASGNVRRGSLANELYDATIISEAKMKHPVAQRRGSLADDLYDASLVAEAKMLVLETSDSARRKSRNAERNRKNSVALSNESCDASILDVPMASAAAVDASQLRTSKTLQEEVAALEGRFPGITAALQPHPTEVEMFTLGPLKLRTRLINDQPMIAVGEGYSRVDTYFTKRAGRVCQILEARGPRQEHVEPVPLADMGKLNQAVSEAAKEVDVDIPGVFKALQTHTSKSGHYRIGTIEFTVKFEGGVLTEATSGMELAEWLRGRKMKVRQAIFSHQQTPRAQSVWSDIDTPR